MYVQDTNLGELKLKVKTLEIQTEELSRERDDLSWTLEVILSFDNFPVKEICPDKSESQFSNRLKRKIKKNRLSVVLGGWIEPQILVEMIYIWGNLSKCIIETDG